MEGNEYGEVGCVLSHIAIHNYNVQLFNPQFLRDALAEHVDEPNEELNKSDVEWDEVHEIWEHLALHSNQMGIAADIFGKKNKKIWKKFTSQFREATDKMHEPIEGKNAAEAKTTLKDLEKPLKMIVKLVK